jgi:hypothetical protein
MSDYLGVHSAFGTTTHVGQILEKDQEALPGYKLKANSENKYDRPYTTTADLKKADLNIAKIRLVSTIPNKKLPDEVVDKAFIGFILTTVSEGHSEKMELVPLPGDSFASYFYGGSPRQFSFSGILLNTEEDQWRDAFEQMYEKYLRGSVSSRNFHIVQISYGGRVVSGWLTSMRQELTSQSDLYAQFSFEVLVSRIDMVGGSKKFTDYLIVTKGGGPFSGANLNTDYAVLNPENYNALVNPVRTGTVIPPKEPRRGGGRRRSNANCFFTHPDTAGGQKANAGSSTMSDHINDSVKCTVAAAIQGTRQKIRDKTKEINRLAKRGAKNYSVDQITALTAEVDKLQKNMIKKLGKKSVKAQAQAEVAAILRAEDKKKKLTQGQTLTINKVYKVTPAFSENGKLSINEQGVVNSSFRIDEQAADYETGKGKSEAAKAYKAGQLAIQAKIKYNKKIKDDTKKQEKATATKNAASATVERGT